MNRSVYLILTGVFAALAIFLNACGKNGGNTSPGSTTATLTVTVTETTGKGLSGFEVTTDPATATGFTDSLGRAVLRDIPFGTYSVKISREGYPPVTAGANLSTGSGKVAFSYIPTAVIRFRHETKGPIQNARVTLEPADFSGITDAKGEVTFTRMPVQNYSFTIRPENLPETTFSAMSPYDGMTLVIVNSYPTVAIISPAEGLTYTSSRPITFSGSGTDIEDGAIPDSMYVWKSSLDGELGRGSKLTVGSLSVGNHTITLSCNDIDGAYGQATVKIFIADLQLDTYFPIPTGDTWSYRYLVPEFFIDTELWTMKKLSVKIYEGNLRSVTMVYDITRNGATLHYSYTVNDYFKLDGTTLSIYKTDETSLEWDTETPYKTIIVNTDYVPGYILFKNVKSITPQSSFSFKTDLSVMWYYVDHGVKSSTYVENESVTVTSKAFDEETIATNAGTFPAMRVVTNERGIDKTVWFTKGLGPVKFEDNSFAPKATAILTDTSLLRFLYPTKPAYRPSDMKTAAPVLHIDRTTPRGMRELHRFLRSMAPR